MELVEEYVPSLETLKVDLHCPRKEKNHPYGYIVPAWVMEHEFFI